MNKQVKELIDFGNKMGVFLIRRREKMKNREVFIFKNWLFNSVVIINEDLNNSECIKFKLSKKKLREYLKLLYKNSNYKVYIKV